MIFLNQKSALKHLGNTLFKGFSKHLSRIFSAAILTLFCQYSIVTSAATPEISGTVITAPAPLNRVLGTLFLTPIERQAVETARIKRNIPRPSRTAPSASAVENTSTPIERSATITGLMRRSDGVTTVWINGELQPNYPPQKAQELRASDVGMIDSAGIKISPSETPQARTKLAAPSSGVVTASNQTKPLKAAKRRVPNLNQSLPKVPVIKPNGLLQPQSLKKSTR